MKSEADTVRPCLYEVSMYDPRTDTRAYLVIDTLQRGLSGGGIRMMPDVDLEMVRRLAKAMTYKFAAARVLAGGAKAGIAADPNGPDREKHLAAFARMAEPFLRSLYVAGEDMGTTAADVALVYRTIGQRWAALARRKAEEQGYEIHIPEDFDPAAAAGENLEEIMTGYGISEVTIEACRFLDLDPSGARVSIQGFGTVGGMTAKFLQEKGLRVTAVADIRGTIHHPEGLPLEVLLSARDAAGNIDRSKVPGDCRLLPREEWMSLDVEILVPAAVADAISKENVSGIRARLVVEGANLPVTEEAASYLFDHGIADVPDFVANVGAAGGLGMILSGQIPLDPMKILEELSVRLRTTTREVLSMSREEGILPREAAIRLAERRLAEALAEAS